MNFLSDYFDRKREEEKQEILDLERMIDEKLSRQNVADILIENNHKRRTEEVLNAYRKHGWQISKAEETKEGIKYHFIRGKEY